MILAICTVALLAIATGSGDAQPSWPPLPDDLERYLAAEVRPSTSERRALLSGEPLTKLLPSDPGVEVAVFGAIWIEAPPAEYVRRVKNIETFEKGPAFHVTRKISDPPTLDDFAQLELSEDDVRDLRRCRPGRCAIKITAAWLDAFRADVRWGTPTENADANAVFRRLALEYVNAYRDGGNAQLAVYRDGNEPVSVAGEFESMIDGAPSLLSMPDLKHYLLSYPWAPLSSATDFLYWQEAHFGLKPMIRINHLVIQDRPGRTVIASKMLYASHYFWTAFEQRILQSDPARGSGFWFVTISRSRSDGLRGLIGRLIRSRIRSEAQKRTETVLTSTRRILEHAASARRPAASAERQARVP